MAKTALKPVENTSFDVEASRAHVHVRESAQMPALVSPHAVVIPPRAMLPIPEPEARDAMTGAFAQLDALEEQIAELNAEKSAIFKELKERGFDIGIVRRVRKERSVDPTLRQAAQDLMRLYEELLTPNQGQ